MKSSRSQSHKTAPKRYKNRLTEDQLRLLESSFDQEKKLEPDRKFQLAYQLGMPAKQVAIWYQNKRARWKNQNIEFDYRAIQQRLESVVAEKSKLQNEVHRLRMELQKAQEKLFALNVNVPPTQNSFSNSCDEDGSSSLPGDYVINGQWQNATQVLQVEELYAFLMGPGDQTDLVNTNNSLFNP